MALTSAGGIHSQTLQIMEPIYIDDAYWMVVKDKYLNIKGEEYTGFAVTIRDTKKQAVRAFLDYCKQYPAYYDGITWTKARKAGYYVKRVHIKATLIP